MEINAYIYSTVLYVLSFLKCSFGCEAVINGFDWGKEIKFWCYIPSYIYLPYGLATLGILGGGGGVMSYFIFSFFLSVLAE